ncbi:MAG: hypothetical protein JXB04_03795 [Kiritimatiellae bacterium]|nr:hypothetical protein [Kiritimatiellia bacterium]
MIRTYLNHVVAGDYDAAVAMVDIQGLANHLMEQRIAVLKRQDPDMTPEEEAATRAQLRDKELRRENLQKILREGLVELDPEGAEWSVGNALKSEKIPNSFIVQCRLTRGETQRVIHIGLRKIGPTWFIAPHIVEQAMMQSAAARTVTAPEPVVAAGDIFWGHWRDGALDEAYALASDAMRKRVSLVKFLESSQVIINQLGPLIAWDILACREMAPGRLHVIYKLDCSKQPVRAMIEYSQKDGLWEISLLAVPYMGP